MTDRGREQKPTPPAEKNIHPYLLMLEVVH